VLCYGARVASGHKKTHLHLHPHLIRSGSVFLDRSIQ
jgi:hypothetical protein